jgi:hypothetical protein
MHVLLLLLMVPPAHADDYADARARLRTRQQELAARAEAKEDRASLRTEARAVVSAAIRDELVPAWLGTPWEFYGQSQTPREGAIACGHWLATVMEHAGFDVPRQRLGEQASEWIVRTFAPHGPVKTWWRVDRDVPLQWVRKQGAGVYLLGLSYHAAMLVHDGERVQVCHASPWAEIAVMCEDPERSAAMVSTVYVVGPALSDAAMDAWIDGRALPIRKRR